MVIPSGRRRWLQGYTLNIYVHARKKRFVLPFNGLIVVFHCWKFRGVSFPNQGQIQGQVPVNSWLNSFLRTLIPNHRPFVVKQVIVLRPNCPNVQDEITQNFPRSAHLLRLDHLKRTIIPGYL